jgi:hypothetical protein
VGETVCHGWVAAGASAVMSLDSYLRSTYLLIFEVILYALFLFFCFFALTIVAYFRSLLVKRVMPVLKCRVVGKLEMCKPAHPTG